MVPMFVKTLGSDAMEFLLRSGRMTSMALDDMAVLYCGLSRRGASLQA